jgi:hypothetical protein
MDRRSPRDAVYAVSMSTRRSVSMTWQVSLSMAIAGHYGEREKEKDLTETERERETDRKLKLN